MATKTPETYKVTGGAAVLALRGGGERYVYRNDLVPASGYLKASIDHAVDLGLLTAVSAVTAVVETPVEVVIEEPETVPGAETPTDAEAAEPTAPKAPARARTK